jgi:hypothetical protein
VVVLDENLLTLRLGNPIAAWYPGRVCYITDLRPGSVIKDEAIPACLQQVKGATFVTTNVADYWRHIPAHAGYSIICLSLPNERLREVPTLLRQLFRLPELKTKAARMGKVVRVSRRQVQYYTVGSSRLHTLAW